MNRDSFATHHREKKVACLTRVLDTIGAQCGASADQLCDFVSGLSERQWADVTVIANRVHTCGVTHDLPSEDAQSDVCDVFTRRALDADRVKDMLAGVLANRADPFRRFDRKLELTR